jgi:hypothetical protein
MTRKWLLALAVSAAAFSAIPASANEDIRGPLSPAGGHDGSMTAYASKDNDQRTTGAGFGFLSQWAGDVNANRGPLSRAGSDS